MTTAPTLVQGSLPEILAVVGHRHSLIDAGGSGRFGAPFVPPATSCYRPCEDPNMARPDSYPWINGRLHSPHFLFLCTVDVPIPHLLELFGYPDAPEQELGFTDSGLRFIHCSNWTHIADDWLYTLWHRRDRLKLYEALSREALLFTFAVGDSDASYEFALYRDGSAVRRRVVTSPHYSDRVVKEDSGEPLPLEGSWLHQSDGEEIGFKLAESLGVEVDQSARPLRCFAIPELDWRRKPHQSPEAS